MQLTSNIWLQELVSRPIYQAWGDRSAMFLDARVPSFLQFLRNRYGKPIILNNWSGGGSFHNRGFRAPNSSVGAAYSQHRFGRAADFHISGMAVQEVYQDILAHQELMISHGISTLENIQFTPTWIHADCRWHTQPGIWVVNP